MTTARKIMPRKITKPDDLLDTDGETPSVTDVIPKATGNATVRTTVTYTASAKGDKDDTEENEYDSEPFRETQSLPYNQAPENHFPRNRFNLPPAQDNTPRNRLADMFSEVRELLVDGDTYYALVTRRADQMNDRFRIKCNTDTTFPPLELTATALFDFVPAVQHYNYNSGGRFSVIVVDSSGEPVGISIPRFVIPDPVVDQPAPEKTHTDLNSQVVDMMSTMMQKSDERFAQMLEAIRTQATPQKDRLSEIIEQKMINDILNPKESEFSADKVIAQIFASQTMIEKLSDQLGNSFNKNDTSDREKTTLEMILGNDMIMSKAGDLVNNIATIASNVVASRQQAPVNGYPPLPQATPTPETPPQPAPEYQASNPAQPAPQPTPETAPTNDAEIEQRMQIIKDIITELESDRPLNQDNVFLKNLGQNYPDLQGGLIMLCKTTDFDTLFNQLEQTLPDVFAEFYSPSDERDENGEVLDELNERGQKIETRLREFYEFMKAR